MSGKIIEYIQANETIAIPELAAKLGVTEGTVERNIKKLQSNNELERIGAARGGKWRIIKLN